MKKMIKIDSIIYIKTMKPPNHNDEFHEHTYRNGRYERVKFTNIGYFERKISFDNLSSIVSSDEYIPKDNDKLFFSEGCTIPRHKVRNWGKEKNITITVKPEKSNVSIVSKSFFNSVIDHSISYRTILLDKQKYIDFIKFNYNTDAVDILIDKIKATSSKYVLVGFNWDDNVIMLGHRFENKDLFQVNYKSHQFTDSELKAKQVKSTYCNMYENNEFDTYQDKTKLKYVIFDDNFLKMKSLNKILNISPNNTIIFDTVLIDVVNQDSITIDKEMFEGIRNMFNSEDKKNHLIALEILANCNYKTSLHKILLIFREFAPIKINNMREKSHVNFKSLIKFININDWYYPSYDDIINSLMDKNYLTKEILSEISILAKKEMEERLRNHGYQVFEIKNITLSNKVKRYFGHDIPYSEKEMLENKI